MSTSNEQKIEFEAKALPLLPKLYRLAYLRLGSKEDAEDVLQDTYLKAFKSYENYSEGNLQAWLTTILLNTIRDAKRKASGSHESELDANENLDHVLELADPKPNPEQELISGELDQNLERALGSTPEWLLTPFLLKEIQQLTYKEISEVLAIPIGTVMSRLSRARKHLCTKLGGSRVSSSKGNVESREEDQK